MGSKEPPLTGNKERDLSRIVQYMAEISISKQVLNCNNGKWMDLYMRNLGADIHFQQAAVFLHSSITIYKHQVDALCRFARGKNELEDDDEEQTAENQRTAKRVKKLKTADKDFTLTPTEFKVVPLQEVSENVITFRSASSSKNDIDSCINVLESFYQDHTDSHRLRKCDKKTVFRVFCGHSAEDLETNKLVNGHPIYEYDYDDDYGSRLMYKCFSFFLDEYGSLQQDMEYSKIVQKQTSLWDELDRTVELRNAGHMHELPKLPQPNYRVSLPASTLTEEWGVSPESVDETDYNNICVIKNLEKQIQETDPLELMTLTYDAEKCEFLSDSGLGSSLNDSAFSEAGANNTCEQSNGVCESDVTCNESQSVIVNNADTSATITQSLNTSAISSDPNDTTVISSDPNNTTVIMSDPNDTTLLLSDPNDTTAIASSSSNVICLAGDDGAVVESNSAVMSSMYAREKKKANQKLLLHRMRSNNKFEARTTVVMVDVLSTFLKCKDLLALGKSNIKVFPISVDNVETIKKREERIMKMFEMNTNGIIGPAYNKESIMPAAKRQKLEQKKVLRFKDLEEIKDVELEPLDFIGFTVADLELAQESDPFVVIKKPTWYNFNYSTMTADTMEDEEDFVGFEETISPDDPDYAEKMAEAELDAMLESDGFCNNKTPHRKISSDSGCHDDGDFDSFTKTNTDSKMQKEQDIAEMLSRRNAERDKKDREENEQREIYDTVNRVNQWHQSVRPILMDKRFRTEFDHAQCGKNIFKEFAKRNMEKTNSNVMPKPSQCIGDVISLEQIMESVEDQSRLSSVLMAAFAMVNKSEAFAVIIENKDINAASELHDVKFKLNSTKIQSGTFVGMGNRDGEEEEEEEEEVVETIPSPLISSNSTKSNKRISNPISSSCDSSDGSSEVSFKVAKKKRLTASNLKTSTPHAQPFRLNELSKVKAPLIRKAKDRVISMDEGIESESDTSRRETMQRILKKSLSSTHGISPIINPGRVQL